MIIISNKDFLQSNLYKLLNWQIEKSDNDDEIYSDSDKKRFIPRTLKDQIRKCTLFVVGSFSVGAYVAAVLVKFSWCPWKN